MPQLANSDASLPRLMGLLRRQLALYERLEGLSREQGAIFARGEPEELAAIISRRQNCIDDLQKLSAELEPFRLGWLEWLPRLTAAQRAEVARLTDRIQALREGIARQDQEDAQRLEDARRRVAAELTHSQRTGQALNGYRQISPALTPSVTDQKG